ncbi:AraC family transcriptional regulator [Paenibacillus sp. IB182496]|uniref:AraC family transcriptional regulator n=1 Tax=Paenibacillus sabuli TaxID=2772509 RepID=A0A927GTH3_9BACL|nr:AraC family transcriptional regulator [Paenibacillus sabuli]MBD2847578.1 AraC family transcriptional regulator [Paenibacillus sabuli]
MEWKEHVFIWSEADVRLLDVRHGHADAADVPLQRYRLPASAFILLVRGSGRLALDGIEHAVRRFHVLHGGKGALVEITHAEQRLEYYLILYKAALVPPYGRGLDRLLEGGDPFKLAYGLSPPEPLTLHATALQMHRCWQLESRLGRLQAKGALYQFVGELIRQLDAASAAAGGDVVAQAMQWIQLRYADELSVEALAEALGCSTSYLSRAFRKRLGMSTLDYVTHVRMSHATRLLRSTDASLREIAAEVGYRDEYYFSRVFKKHALVSPLQFRQGETLPSGKVQIYPSVGSDRSIVPRGDNHYHLHENENRQAEEGEWEVGRMYKPSTMAAMLLGMSLLFAACGAPAGNTAAPANETPSGNSAATGNEGATSGNAASRQGQQPSNGGAHAEQPQTRQVQHLMGTTDIPAQPQRIMVAGLEDIALALEVPLAQASVPTGHYLYETLEGQGVEIIADVGDTLNYEAILQGSPELIIASDLAVYEQDIYDQLSKIAPTIVYARGDWRSSIVELGEALGRQEQAQRVVQQYADKLGQASAAIKQAGNSGSTVAAIRPSIKEVQVFYPWFVYTELLYSELGLEVSPAIAARMEDAEEGTWGEIAALETFPELTADHLFVVVGSSYSTAEQYEEELRGMAEVEELEIWKRHPAVKQEQVYMVSARHWMLNGPTADAMKIDDVVRALTGAQ